MENKLVLLKSFSNEVEARLTSAHLESQGIQTYVKKDDCGGTYPPLQMSMGVKLLVDSKDEQKAISILNEIEAEKSFKKEPKMKKTHRTKAILVIGFFLLGLSIGFILSSKFHELRMATSEIIKTDTNGDNRPDIFYYYRRKNLSRVESDRNYDGRIDILHRYTDNKISRSEYDDNFDGDVDGWVMYENENNFEWKVDTDFNGKPDATLYFQHQIKTRVDWQPNGSPIVVRREIFKNGNKHQEFIDSEQDGKFDFRRDFDSFGNEVQRIKLPIITSNN